VLNGTLSLLHEEPTKLLVMSGGCETASAFGFNLAIR
jgi:hypothetical protein